MRATCSEQHMYKDFIFITIVGEFTYVLLLLLLLLYV